MHANCQFLLTSFGQRYFTTDSQVLEVGCTPSRAVFPPHRLWHTADINEKLNPTFVCSQYHIPTPHTYDIVLSANTVEHVRKPWVWIAELARVCAPGGHVIVTCPTNWPYHEDPIDCWRIYPDGMKALLEEAGLCNIVSLSRWGNLETDEERRWFHEGALALDTIGIGEKV